MSKNTPLARGVRTFAHSMTAVLGAAVIADWVSDYHAAAVALTIGTITALVAGIAAFALAAGGISATTLWGKALATALQFFGAGIATVGIADLTTDAVHDFGVAILRVVIAAVLAGLTTLAVNASEDQAPVTTRR